MSGKWDVEINMRNGAKLFRHITVSDIAHYVKEIRNKKKSMKSLKPLWPWVLEISTLTVCKAFKTSPRWIDSVTMKSYK